MAKVSMKLFTDLIYNEYMHKNIATTIYNNSVYHVAPLIKLTKEQNRILTEGDGQTENQYKQINSSTGLAVNYYKLLEELGTITDLVLENKIAKPLNKGGRFANLDVSYNRDGVLYFVESKFLEPYYSGNETIKDSYLDVSKYPIEVENNKKEWRELFSQSAKFAYYNFSQLCRHLLALYRYTHGIKGSSYNGEKVVLQSVTWEMTEQFMAKLEDQNRKEMKERIDQLKFEANECQQIINNFITEIGWNNMTFQARHYNDMLDNIKLSKHYEDFCNRYFLTELQQQ